MATVTLKGNEINTNGKLPEINQPAPYFNLVAGDLSEVTLNNHSGKNIILNIFPSIDTSTCAQSVRTFNERIATLDNSVVLCISADLPFAQSRFCGAEGIENVQTLSTFRSSFGKDYGVEFVDGPLKGLLARSIVVINSEGKVTYTELVEETVNEPSYDRALQALS